MTAYVRVSPLMCLLALLSMTVMPGTLGRPSNRIGDTELQLDITSSASIGQPIFGETVGPITSGKNLVLTCSLHGYHPSIITWWEDNTQLEANEEADRELTSSSLALKELSVKDTGRRFTCRAKETNLVKSVVLEIVGPLDILRDAKLLVTEDTVKCNSGEEISLSCILQGYNPASVSWWEGETELQAETERTQYSSSSNLTLQTVTATDSGRRFTCRSQENEIPRTLQLEVKKDYAPQTRQFSWIFLVTVLLVLLLALMMIFHYKKFCYNSTSDDKKLLNDDDSLTSVTEGSKSTTNISKTSDEFEDDSSSEETASSDDDDSEREPSNEQQFPV